MSPESINLEEKTAVLTGDEWLHAAKVMRLKVGDEIKFFDGCGKVYDGVISSSENKSFAIQVKTLDEKTLNWNLSVFIGLSKGSKIDLITRALTEAGATSITGFISKYSVIKKVNAPKADRLRKIAVEACKQSERAYLPRIEIPVSFDELLRSVGDFDKTVVFYEKAQHFLSPSEFNNKNIALIIGPKGGLSEDEVKQLEAKGVLVSSLNDAVLKVETAAIAAASIVRYTQLLSN